MSAPLLVTTALGVLLAAAPPAGSPLVPCAPESSAWRKAHDALTAYSSRLDALPEDGDTREARLEMKSLMRLGCFALAREERAGDWPLEWDAPATGVSTGSRSAESVLEVSALALKTWWRDGGRAWLESYLELGRPGPHTAVIPPALREPVLTPERAPRHPLAALLCPAGSGDCGARTEVWRARAEEAFVRERKQEAERERADHGAADALPEPGIPRTVADCEGLARAKPAALRYMAWRYCLTDFLDLWPRRDVLPLGNLRTPTEGWLVLRGRDDESGRGRMEVLHLGTGATYLVRGAAGEVRVVAGLTEVERLRELTWMLVLSHEVREEVRADVWRVPIPSDFSVTWWKDASWERTGRMSGVVGGSTDATRVTWRWSVPGVASPYSGTFVYSLPEKMGEVHARSLLRAADSTFHEGCPPVLPPGSSVLGASAEVIQTWSPPPGCSPGAGRAAQ
ncbi:hypothetical protein KRR26_16400 [Corallococcus sp. M34]|uniref:hypothetical protein n=1 Tax=Citreicoccus inhibens TaxID=2849499 RepID=UPI001C2418BB|nr:hypothetical protein [Citreicoccus inhibens]MBU8897198.1 hypothetical protein [Citreicoccus inhibens]